MTLVVTTPELVEALQLVRDAMTGLDDQTLERPDVAMKLNASGRITQIVSADTKRRLSASKIRAQEGKLIEGHVNRPVPALAEAAE